MKAVSRLQPLGEVCLIQPPKSEARERLKPTDSVSFVPMDALGIQRKGIGTTANRSLSEVVGSYTYFADDDVLLAKITPCFENGKLGIASGLTNGIGFGSSEFIVLRPSTLLSPQYLYYFLLQDSFREDGARNMTGTAGQKRVTRSYVESCLIPIPPVSEQERIVAVLDKAFEGIAMAQTNVEKNLKNARDLFDGRLAEVFSTSWRSAKIVKLVQLATDVVDGDHMPPPKALSGVPFVTISNINKQSHAIDFSDTYFVSKAYFDNLKENRKPRIGDLLYTVTGSYGIPVKIEDDREFCFQRHIGMIRPKPEVSTSWLYYLVRSPQLRRQADERATGTAQKTVSLSTLRDFDVPQVGIADQQKIATELDGFELEVERLERVQRDKLLFLDQLKQSLLHQAFSGKL